MMKSCSRGVEDSGTHVEPPQPSEAARSSGPTGRRVPVAIVMWENLVVALLKEEFSASLVEALGG